MVRHPVAQGTQRCKVSPCPTSGRYDVRPLSTQPRRAPAHCLALGQRRRGRRRGIDAGRVENAPGELPCAGTIPVRGRDHPRQRRIHPRSRLQDRAAVARAALVMILSRIDIQLGGPLQ
jgi:hypothetical protein